MMARLLASLFIIIVVFITVSQCTSNDKLSPQFGVPPEKLQYYKGDSFTCFGSGKTIPIGYVNDDYCDCSDGSDEPGTSACSNGQFYCRNKGYKGQLISSILVNDGICDCCDGSDEQTGLVKCQDTCAELSKEMRKARDEAIQKYTTGLKIKEEMINEAVGILKSKQEELEKTKKEIEPLNQEIKELEVIRDNLHAKKKEREEQLAAERKAKQELERQQNETKTEQKSNEENVVEEVNQQQQQQQQQEQEQVDGETGLTGVVVNNDDEEEQKPQQEQQEPQDQQLEETNNDESTFFDKLQGYVSAAVDVISQYLPQSKLSEVSEIQQVDSKIREKNRELREKNESIEKLEKLLTTDMGPNNVFLPLFGKCFDAPTKDYTYTMCPFDNAKQGHTGLGKFEEWGPNHSSMSFTNGVQCWGGPKRSLKVTVECGSENTIYDVQEPSKCEYTMKFTTPAACDNEHLKILQLEDDHSF